MIHNLQDKTSRATHAGVMSTATAESPRGGVLRFSGQPADELFPERPSPLAPPSAPRRARPHTPALRPIPVKPTSEAPAVQTQPAVVVETVVAPQVDVDAPRVSAATAPPTTPAPATPVSTMPTLTTPAPTKPQPRVASKKRQIPRIVSAGRRPSFLFALVATLAACNVIALLFGNPITAGLVFFLSITALNGYRVGARRLVAMILALLVGGLIGAPLGGVCDGLVSMASDVTGLVAKVLAILIVVPLLTVAAYPAFCWALRRLMNRYSWIAKVDRPAGTALGLSMGVGLGALIVWGTLALEPLAADRLALYPDAPSAETAKRVISCAEMIRGSAIGPVAEKANPISGMRVVSLPGKCVKVLNRPQALGVFVNHPAIGRIQESPAFQRAVKTLKDDPEICDRLGADEHMTLPDVVAILCSPKVSAILEDRELIEEATAMVGDLEEAIDEALAKSENMDASCVVVAPGVITDVPATAPLPPKQNNKGAKKKGASAKENKASKANSKAKRSAKDSLKGNTAAGKKATVKKSKAAKAKAPKKGKAPQATTNV